MRPITHAAGNEGRPDDPSNAIAAPSLDAFSQAGVWIGICFQAVAKPALEAEMIWATSERLQPYGTRWLKQMDLHEACGHGRKNAPEERGSDTELKVFDEI